MRIRDNDTFNEKVNLLLESAVEKPSTRYVASIRPSCSEIRLKVTDDRVCLQSTIDKQDDIKRFLMLNRAMMEKLQNRQPRVAKPAPASATTPPTGHGKGHAGKKKKKGKK
ncbi:hypothetical protein AMAG_02697 [Allomyces macrogynus ATCC 38327]|uniref:SRP9 domain-containing protein n=1 Tax=Allomyces macrogynus (strain ATCC 38327) TaxID=578462 RepID=A0A0L0S3E0_ALLM3|nr:hypothetical protein AMAG_02697 [Allomyces macrogynus ATCC 38327]|eukprot:KNE56930.1 hypothetical protein AMAG_02697 [Allomyces macrogynus ATCC 38327]